MTVRKAEKNKTDSGPVNWDRVIFDLKNQKEDLQYTAQIAMTRWGIDPETFYRQDYYTMMTTMSAKPREDRIQDPASIIPTSPSGQTPKGIVSLSDFARLKQSKKGGSH